jgi:hypothetical protein
MKGRVLGAFPGLLMMGALSKSQDDRDEQLLKLYWNRAGVKRELKTLKKERFELLDKLKDHEDAIVRAREQLDGLERLLVNPIAAANAMVYFQLRNVWRVAAQKLEQFSAELEMQRQKRERKNLHDAAIAKRQRRFDAITQNIRTLNEARSSVSREHKDLLHDLERMNPLVKLLRGRSLRSKIALREEEAESLAEQVADQKDLAEKIQGEPLPEISELSIESRRIINAAVIALAQHIVLHFAANKLAILAREAMSKSVADMRFGDRRECDRMVESIRGRIADLRESSTLADQVRQRAAVLAKELKYRNDSDTMATPFSTPMIMPALGLDSKGRREADAPIAVNVIADDYWDLSRFLR